MKISLVIPVYNEEKIIKQCLEAIFKQIEPANEVILVDNNCTDRSMAIAKKYPVRIIKEKRQGISYARNAGFNAARYELIGRIDSDTVLPVDWTKKVRQIFNQHPQYLAVTGPIFFNNLPLKPILSSIHSGVYYHFLKRIHGHYLMIGCNMALRRIAWQKVRNQVIMNNKEVHEDLDLAIQIAKYGEIGYEKELKTDISGRRLMKFPSNLEYLYRYNKMLARLFILKNYQQVK